MANPAKPNALNALLDDLIARDDPLTRSVPAKVVCVDAPGARKIARFAEINAFVDSHGRTPSDKAKEAGERGLSASLRAMRAKPSDVALLSGYDDHGLLGIAAGPSTPPLTMDQLLELDDPMLRDEESLFQPLPDVPEPEEDATRIRSGPDRGEGRRRCLTFDAWRGLFAKIRADISAGRRRIEPAKGNRNIDRGHAFILNGHVAIVVEVAMVPNGVGGRHERLRVIYDNATESDHLLESFRKALIDDPESRRISHPDGSVGGMFEALPDEPRPGIDGRIYVARTLSTATELADIAPHILKIGRTGGETARRMAGASRDPTYLFAAVQVVRSYALHGYDPKDVEKALHAFLAPAAMTLSMTDGFGRAVDAREWFMVTPEIVDQAIALVVERRLGEHRYDPETNRIAQT